MASMSCCSRVAVRRLTAARGAPSSGERNCSKYGSILIGGPYLQGSRVARGTGAGPMVSSGAQQAGKGSHSTMAYNASG